MKRLQMDPPSVLPLHAHDCRFCVASQKGLQSPARHRPMSTHVVLSSAFSGGGHSLLFPLRAARSHGQGQGLGQDTAPGLEEVR